jgi:hypothetical protein
VVMAAAVVVERVAGGTMRCCATWNMLGTHVRTDVRQCLEGAGRRVEAATRRASVGGESHLPSPDPVLARRSSANTARAAAELGPFGSIAATLV